MSYLGNAPKSTNTIKVQRFSGNGATTTFSLSLIPASENNTQVFVNGVYQQKNTYSMSGNSLIFDTAPIAGVDNIEVSTVSILPVGTNISEQVTYDGTTVKEVLDGIKSTGGSALVGYDGGTVQDVLDSAKPLANYTALRAYTGRATSVRITDSGIAGFFTRDSDVVTGDNGGTVIVDASGRRWKRVFDSNLVNAQKFGLSDSSTASQNAAALLKAMESGESIFIPKTGSAYQIGELELPNKHNIISSNGAALNGVSGTFILRQRKRGALTTLSGLKFTGNATGFDYYSDDLTLPASTSNREYEIYGCHFLQVGSVDAIRLYGAREGFIDHGYFEFNNGVHAEAGTINLNVSQSHFRGCNYGVFSELTAGVANTEGVKIYGGTMIGCGYGVRADRTTGVQIIGAMIDYCDNPIALNGTTEAVVDASYISTRTVNPAISVKDYGGSFRGFNYSITNNQVRDNHSTTGSACISLQNADYARVHSNTLGNYASDGIVYDNCTLSDIYSNTVRPRAGFGTNSIRAVTDDATVRVYDNRVSQPISRSAAASSTFRNVGFVTENSGEAVAASGSTSVVVNHGLALTPLKQNISLTPTTIITGGIQFYVSAITSTTFTITFASAITNTVGIVWQVKTRQ